MISSQICIVEMTLSPNGEFGMLRLVTDRSRRLTLVPMGVASVGLELADRPEAGAQGARGISPPVSSSFHFHAFELFRDVLFLPRLRISA